MFRNYFGKGPKKTSDPGQSGALTMEATLSGPGRGDLELLNVFLFYMYLICEVTGSISSPPGTHWVTTAPTRFAPPVQRKKYKIPPLYNVGRGHRSDDQIVTYIIIYN